MSRAFVKDMDVIEDLPDRLISEHPNLVTAEGLARIEGEVRRLTAEHAEAQAQGDRERTTAIARDLRYWTARLASAELVAPPADKGRVHFGSTVTIERSSGRKQTFRIVGEDEADPAKGTIPYVAPLARALSGKEVGDVIRFAEDEIEVLGVE